MQQHAYLHLCHLIKELMRRLDEVEKQLKEVSNSATVTINWEEEEEDESGEESDETTDTESAHSAPF